jgi:hypothetical protein
MQAGLRERRLMLSKVSEGRIGENGLVRVCSIHSLGVGSVKSFGDIAYRSYYFVHSGRWLIV